MRQLILALSRKVLTGENRHLCRQSVVVEALTNRQTGTELARPSQKLKHTIQKSASICGQHTVKPENGYEYGYDEYGAFNCAGEQMPVQKVKRTCILLSITTGQQLSTRVSCLSREEGSEMPRATDRKGMISGHARSAFANRRSFPVSQLVPRAFLRR